MHSPSLFSRIARWIANLTGRPIAFAVALLVVVVWAASGPLFGFSDTWQLVINTGTTITTFLMVFLIQNTQNRDTKALQIKVDELIRATRGAHNALLDLEELEETDIERVRRRYEALARTARDDLRDGLNDTDQRDLDNDEDEDGKGRSRATPKPAVGKGNRESN